MQLPETVQFPAWGPGAWRGLRAGSQARSSQQLCCGAHVPSRPGPGGEGVPHCSPKRFLTGDVSTSPPIFPWVSNTDSRLTFSVGE